MRYFLTLLLTCSTLLGQRVFSLSDSAFLGRDSRLLDNLEGYWRLEESSGTRYDQSKNGNHMTANNSPGQTVGKVGNCATLTSASSQFMSAPSNSSIQVGDIPFTISCWVKASTLGSDRTIISKYDNNNNKREWSLGYLFSNLRFRFIVSSDGGSVNTSSVLADALGAPSVGVWYFVVAWHDPDANTVNIQVNNGTANSASWSSGVFSSTSPLQAGCIGSTQIQFWDGSIDEIGFWKRILTTAEKTELYNSGSGVSFPRFLSYYHQDLRDRWEPDYRKLYTFPTLIAQLNRQQESITLWPE